MRTLTIHVRPLLKTGQRCGGSSTCRQDATVRMEFDTEAGSSNDYYCASHGRHAVDVALNHTLLDFTGGAER